jgi:hypothetical protein
VRCTPWRCRPACRKPNEAERQTTKTERQTTAGILKKDFAAAAVHAGLLEPLEVAVIKVTAVAPPAQIAGSVRTIFGRYGSAYRLATI